MSGATYTCDICGATKELVCHPTTPFAVFRESIPTQVICGWQGCTNYALRNDIREKAAHDARTDVQMRNVFADVDEQVKEETKFEEKLKQEREERRAIRDSGATPAWRKIR